MDVAGGRFWGKGQGRAIIEKKDIKGSLKKSQDGGIGITTGRTERCNVQGFGIIAGESLQAQERKKHLSGSDRMLSYGKRVRKKKKSNVCHGGVSVMGKLRWGVSGEKSSLSEKGAPHASQPPGTRK